MGGESSAVPPREAEASAVAERLRDAGVRLVACTFVDNAGIPRVKVVPIGRLDRVARYGVGISYTFATFAVNDHIAASPDYGSPTGDMRLIPDLESAVVLPDKPGWAWAPVWQFDQDFAVMPICQRSLLERAVAQAREQGVTFRMAFEVEFTVFDAAGEPIHRGPGYSPRALVAVDDLALAVVDALEAEGITVEQFHPEYSPGQCEISVAATEPVSACDTYVLLRYTIQRIAVQHGFGVEFAPVAIPDEVGNGCHLHFSAWREEWNLMQGGDGPEGLTAEGEAIGAGVLRRLPELPAVLTPSVPSYARLQPSHWSGAYACWGRENREAALRFITGMRGSSQRSANFELKPLDGTANPYLAAALIVFAGIEGMGDHLRLPAQTLVDPATLSDEQREERGIVRLAGDLGAAIGALERSDFAKRVLGAAEFEAFLAVRRLELDTYGSMQEPERLAAHRWRYG